MSKPFIPLEQNALELMSRGFRPVLMSHAWYPVIEVEVSLRERSREEMTEVELALLGVLEGGVTVLGDLLAVLAIKERFAKQILSALRDQGLVELVGNQIRTSDLGRISLREGALIRDVQRAIVVCGLNGDPLSRSVHDLPRLKPHQMASSARPSERIIEPIDGVPHRLLSINIEDLRTRGGRQALAELGIPDEAIEIRQILGARGMYIRAGVVVARAENGQAWDASIWLSPKLRLAGNGRIEQLIKDAETAVAEASVCGQAIAKAMGDKGVVLRDVPKYLPGYGMSGVVERMAYERPPLQIAWRSVLHRVGTPAQPPRPIWEMAVTENRDGHPRRQDYLDGACMYLTTDNPQVSAHAEALRCAWDACDAHFRKPFKGRPAITDDIRKALAASGHDIEGTLELARFSGDTGLLKHFESQESGAA